MRFAPQGGHHQVKGNSNNVGARQEEKQLQPRRSTLRAKVLCIEEYSCFVISSSALDL
jgi:hypothetical protein